MLKDTVEESLHHSIKSRVFREAISEIPRLSVNESSSNRTVSRITRKVVIEFRDFSGSLLGENKHLTNALATIRNIEDQFESGDVQPPQALITSVEHLIRRMYEIMNLPLDIFSMPEGDITISVCSKDRCDMVFFHCDTNGTVYCAVDIGEQNLECTYDDIDLLPDSFVIDGVNGLFSENG